MCVAIAEGVISTHTLTWSVTGDIGAVFGDYKDFNSHAHVERDDSRYHSGECEHISTHTLTWSVTINAAYFLPVT